VIRNCDCFHRSKSRNISAEELFRMMQYLGRLYDHDPDNIKVMQKLHRILLGKDQSYDVDSMMKNVSLISKSSSIYPYVSLYIILPLFTPLSLSHSPLLGFGFFTSQNLTEFYVIFQEV
jgi:hypothetical protein